MPNYVDQAGNKGAFVGHLILSGDSMAHAVQRFALILQAAVNTSSLRLNPILRCGPWLMSRVDLEIS